MVKVCMVLPRCQMYKIVKNIAEKFNRVSSVHQRHKRQTTDRRQTPLPLAEHNVVTFG